MANIIWFVDNNMPCKNVSADHFFDDIGPKHRFTMSQNYQIHIETNWTHFRCPSASFCFHSTKFTRSSQIICSIWKKKHLQWMICTQKFAALTSKNWAMNLILIGILYEHSKKMHKNCYFLFFVTNASSSLPLVHRSNSKHPPWQFKRPKKNLKKLKKNCSYKL